MASRFLPPESPIARAMRGWPTSPGKRPHQPVRSAVGELQAFVEILPSGHAYDRIGGGRVAVESDAVQATGSYESPWYAGQTSDVLAQNLPVSVRDANLLVIELYSSNRAIDGAEFGQQFCQLNGGSSSAHFASISTSQAVDELFEVFNSTATTTNGGNYVKYTDGYSVAIDTLTTVVVAHIAGQWQIYIDGAKCTMYDNVAGGSDGTLFNGTQLTRIGAANFSHDPQVGCTTVQFYRIPGLSNAIASKVAKDPFALLKPINDTPYLVATSGGAASYTLTADSQSYTLTGNAAPLTAARTLTATTQSYALAGNAATFALGYVMPADVQLYTLTGYAAGLTQQLALAADVQTYTLTGIAAGLTYTPVGSYALTADTQSYTLTGTAMGLEAHRRLTADVQTYSLTGNAANLYFGYTMPADVQTYTLTGYAAGLTSTRVLTADPQTYTLTGNAATLTYTPAGSYILTAEAANYSLFGVSAAFLYARIMAAQTTNFVLTGTDATTAKGYNFTVDTGAFSLLGNAAAFDISRGIVASSGTFTLFGYGASLQYSEIVVPLASAHLVNADRSAKLIGYDRKAHLIN